MCSRHTARVTTTAIALSILVHLTNAADVPAPVLRETQHEVAAMFGDIGVHIEWSEARATRGAEAIRVILLPYETGALRLDQRMILGAAMGSPAGVGMAWVFYRRVTAEANHHGVPIDRLLACAVAHELGHLLQNSPAHTNSGLMRATWDRLDFRHAARGRLRFTSDNEERFASFVTARGIETPVP